MMKQEQSAVKEGQSFRCGYRRISVIVVNEPCAHWEGGVMDAYVPTLGCEGLRKANGSPCVLVCQLHSFKMKATKSNEPLVQGRNTNIPWRDKNYNIVLKNVQCHKTILSMCAKILNSSCNIITMLHFFRFQGFSLVANLLEVVMM